MYLQGAARCWRLSLLVRVRVLPVMITCFINSIFCLEILFPLVVFSVLIEASYLVLFVMRSYPFLFVSMGLWKKKIGAQSRIDRAGYYLHSLPVRSCPSIILNADFLFVVIVISRLLCNTALARGGGKLRHLGLDDYITAGCIVVLVITCILVNIGSSHGVGRRTTTLQLAQQVGALKRNFNISSVLIWSLSLPTFAIIAILKRMLDYGTKTTFLFWGLALSSQGCILVTSIWWFRKCILWSMDGTEVYLGVADPSVFWRI